MWSKLSNSLLKTIHRQIYKEYDILYRNLSLKTERTETAFKNYKTEDTIQEELLLKAVTASNIPTVQEWSNLKTTVLQTGKSINSVNFDARVLGYCIAEKNFQAGKSLLEFYQSQNEYFNIGAVGKFMKLYHVFYEDSPRNKNDEELIILMYRKLKEQYPILTSITAENVIPALALTKEWKECLNLLENLKLSMTPTIGSYSSIIKAAFDNNELELGWNLILEMSKEEKFPHPSVYHSFINRILANKNKIDTNVNQLLMYFSDYNISPTKDVLDKIIDVLKSYNYSGSYTTITKTGTCNCCKKSLAKLEINTEEFNQLKSVFMQNVIIGKDIFSKTNPQELEKFKSFLNSTNYNFVIDGLNVAYSAGNKKSPIVYGKILANVVRHFKLKNKQILVLGRKHIMKWPKQYIDFIQENSRLFLTENLSQDDPFLLYAAMSGKLGTCFLSRDFMRGHMYLLMDPSLRKLFRKWQQMYQYSLIYAENGGKVHIKNPFQYSCAPQNDNGWHIPYLEKYVTKVPQSFDAPKNWLCLKPKL